MYKQEEPEINFDQVLKRVRGFFGRFKLGGGGGFGALIVIGALAIALAVWLFTGFYQVEPGEEAALRLFGKFDGTEQAGLHWYPPSPIGTVAVVNVDERRRLELGVRGGTPVLIEAQMITGDENIVDVQLLIQYDVKDISKFLFRVVDPAGATIKDAAETSLRQVVGARIIDDILTTGREDVQAETRLLLQRLLDNYDSGIAIQEVKLLDVFAPEQVKDAFDDVVRAQENKEQIINLANAYKEDILPRARGEASRLLEAAEAFRQEQIAIATGQADRFNQILDEFSLAPEVTRQRLFLEAMEDILPFVKKFVVAEEAGGNLLQFLPLTDSNQTILPGVPPIGGAP